MIVGFFDGSMKKNPSNEAYYGFHANIYGKSIKGYGKIKSELELSNNSAEYAGLSNLLLALIEYKEHKITVFGDSKMVIFQMFHGWKIKNRMLYYPQAIECQKILSEFKDVSGRWIPRENNELADSLSKEHDKADLEFV